MINVITILGIIIVHFIADFILQTHEQAVNKSSSNKYLAQHILSYTVATTLFWFCLPWIFHLNPGNMNIFKVFIITFVAHFTTDYFTSRWTKKLWLKQDTHNFFVVIGFDQVLHYTQLFLLYLLMK